MKFLKNKIYFFIFLLLFFNINIINAVNVKNDDIKKITIVSSKNYKPTVDALLKIINDSNYNVKILYLNNKPLKLSSTDLVISFGRTSAKKVFETLFIPHNSEVPINYNGPALLTVLTPKFQYQKYLEEIKELKYKLPGDTQYFSAIFREQPIDRKLKAIQDIFPNIKKIGVLINNYDREVLKSLYQETKKRNLDLILTKNKYSHTLIQSLFKTLDQSDILLALPDPNIFNPFTSKGIFVSSFRKGIPVFGYTKSYVDAGAVAAIYSTPNQISKQISEMISKFFKNNKNLPAANSPKYYSLAKNKKILSLLHSANTKNKDNN